MWPKKSKKKKKSLLWELPLWHRGLRIQVQWLVAAEVRFSFPGGWMQWVKGSRVATAVVGFSLPRELPHAEGATIKKKGCFCKTPCLTSTPGVFLPFHVHSNLFSQPNLFLGSLSPNPTIRMEPVSFTFFFLKPSWA